MLQLYRRHQRPCRSASRRYRNCSCPIWVQGSLRGEYIRRSLHLRSWSAATDLVRDWEAAGEIGVAKKPDTPTIGEATALFMMDLRAQQLVRETIRKYENLLNSRLQRWCEDKGFRHLKQLGVDEVRQFRSSWADSAVYAAKNLERLRAFFRFCVHGDWMPKNPASAVKAPKTSAAPTLPFTKDEVQRILAACDEHDGNQVRLRAFVLVMRYTGLRIGDTIALEASRISGGKLLLYTAKTGTPVYVPLPHPVVAALSALPITDSGRFFSTGRAKPQTARANWSRYLDRLFELARIEGGHSHRFRDTFAVELLTAGVPLESVSVLLGHSSIKVTERHYRPWVRALQRKLEEQVASAWASDAQLGDEGALNTPRRTDQAS